MKIFAIIFLAVLSSACKSKNCTLDDISKAALSSGQYIQCLSELDQRPESNSAVVENALISGLETVYTRSVTKPEPSSVSVAEHILRALHKRGKGRPADEALMYGIYLLNDRPQDAKRLAETSKVPSLLRLQFPRLNVSATRQEGLAAYWTFSSENSLEESFVDLQHGIHLVVIASPGCHFCHDLASWVNADPTRSEIFRKYAIFVDRPDTQFGVSYYTVWNNENKSTPMHTIFNLENWITPAMWATPQFFLLRDGRLEASMEGWVDTTPKRLANELEKLGINVSAAFTKQAGAGKSDALDPKFYLAAAEQLMSPIRNHNDLDNYLASHEVNKTPLGMLSVGARERFLKELVFGPKGGLAGFYTGDLESELTISQIYELLALFGEQQYTFSMQDAKVLTSRDQALKALIQGEPPERMAPEAQHAASAVGEGPPANSTGN